MGQTALLALIMALMALKMALMRQFMQTRHFRIGFKNC